MKTLGTHAFVNQVLVGLIVTIGFGGTVGLGTVWMRHQISVVADNNASLQKQIVETERRIADTNALVEEAMRSDVLRQQNESMHLGLVVLNPAQVNRVSEDPVLRLVALANRRASERDVGSIGMIQLNIPAPDAAQVSEQPPRPVLTPAVPVIPFNVGAAASAVAPKFAPGH
jgi:hypothetical protein